MKVQVFDHTGKMIEEYEVQDEVIILREGSEDGAE